MTTDLRQTHSGKKKRVLQAKCLESTGDISALSQRLREAYQFGPIGHSRQETEKSLHDFLSNMLPSASASALNAFYSSGNRKSFLDDPLVIEACLDLMEFALRYRENFINKSLGGALKVKHTKKQGRWPVSRAPITPDIFSDKRITYLLDYLKELVHLYYESGLKCWWGPFYQFTNDLAEWAGPPKPLDTTGITLDGMLGPLFGRYLHDQLSDDKEILSRKAYPEYLLAGMSRDEQSKEMGVIHSRYIHNKMEEWGYRHGNKWDRRDFDMLFDRLYLRLSVEEISSRYGDPGFDESTVRRNTKNLCDLLGLNLPRASHKTHIKH